MSGKPEDAVSAVDIAYRQNRDSSFTALASDPVPADTLFIKTTSFAH